jgi:hypothetical protein
LAVEEKFLNNKIVSCEDFVDKSVDNCGYLLLVARISPGTALLLFFFSFTPSLLFFRALLLSHFVCLLAPSSTVPLTRARGLFEHVVAPAVDVEEL